MNKCCLNFIGTFCTEDGTTVVGFVQMVDGVPTFLYFNLSDGALYTGIVYTDACDGGGGGNATIISVAATTDDTVTDALITGNVVGIMAFNGQTFTIGVMPVGNLTQAGTTVSINDGQTWGTGTILTIFMN